MNEKIKLFMESEVIVSSHSGSLTLTLFANKNAKVIEVLNQGIAGCAHHHYTSICNTLNLKYNRYSNIVEDTNGNFNINVADFEKYLLNLL
jgi:capsular polysaccharide biosynthesis protein